jgi:hypothetical protein
MYGSLSFEPEWGRASLGSSCIERKRLHPSSEEHFAMNLNCSMSGQRDRRPKQDRSVIVRMDSVLVERMDRYAARERTTRAAIVRRVLLDLLKRDDAERESAKRAA